MKILKYIIASGLIGTALGLSGCKLESEVYDKIGGGQFPKTESDAEALVTANAYGVFRSDGYSGIFTVARGTLLLSDLLSDYGECSWRGWEPVLYLSFDSSDNDNNITNSLWSYSNFMGKMTVTIDRIEKLDINSEKKERMLAELHLGRGWLGFLLWDFYGPIPIAGIDDLKNPLEEKILPRVSEEEMQNFIESEIKMAIPHLPASFKKGDANYGRFTKGLANMILLKFYMQTKRWDKAIEAGKELQKEEYGYDLVPDYNDIFTLENEKNVETIWAVNCLTGTQSHKWHPHVLPNDYPSNPPHAVKWNGFKLSWPFMHTFEEGDKRLERIIYEYVGTTGVVHNEENDIRDNEKLKYGAAPLKYQIDPNTTGEDSEVDYIIYRYADALTLYAEALVRQSNTVQQESVDILNKIRKRAGLKEYAMSDFTGARDFLDKLLLERAHELYYEGCRRQDLIRDGSYISKMIEKASHAGYSTKAKEGSTDYYHIALPNNIINEGKGIVKQNPGFAGYTAE